MSLLLPNVAKAMQAKRKQFGPRNPRGEIIEMQRLLLQDIRNCKTRPHIRAQCVRAYDILEERLRILNGKPLPGMLRPDGDWRTPKKRKAPAVVPLPDVAPKVAPIVPENTSKESLSPPDRPHPPHPGGGQNEGVA
jgi:hypothetical protein